MKRVTQHSTVSDQFAIKQRSMKLLEHQLPDKWILRPQEPDFFIDYFLEFSDEGELNGIQTAIQLKGTLPGKPLRRPKFQLEGKALRYYVQKCTTPVFLILADLSCSTLYWVFVQGFAKTGLNEHRLKQKFVSIHFDPANTLADLPKFKSAILKAEKFMRELRPGSIQSAVLSRKESLELIDQRLKVDVEFVNGNEHIKVKAVEPFSFTTRFAAKEPHVAYPGLNDFIETGRPVEFDVTGLKLMGSPLFEKLQRGGDGKISLKPIRSVPAELMLFVPPSIIIPFTGQMTGGTKFAHFASSLANSPLTVSVSLPLKREDSASASFSLNFEDECWSGKEVSSLPYFDQTRHLFRAVFKNIPVTAELTLCGNQIARFEMKDLDRSHLNRSMAVLDFLHYCRLIAKQFDHTFNVPDFNAISDSDVETVFELGTLIANRRHEGPADTIGHKFHVKDLKDIPESRPFHVELSYGSKQFNFFNNWLQLGPVRLTISDVEITSTVPCDAGFEVTVKGSPSSRQVIEWLPDRSAPQQVQTSL